MIILSLCVSENQPVDSFLLWISLGQKMVLRVANTQPLPIIKKKFLHLQKIMINSIYTPGTKIHSQHSKLSEGSLGVIICNRYIWMHDEGRREAHASAWRELNWKFQLSKDYMPFLLIINISQCCNAAPVKKAVLHVQYAFLFIDSCLCWMWQ